MCGCHRSDARVVSPALVLTARGRKSFSFQSWFACLKGVCRVRYYPENKDQLYYPENKDPAQPAENLKAARN